MSARTSATVPDAWDDNWEAQIDCEPRAQAGTAEPSAAPVPEKKLSSRAIKAQKRAQHAEFNRQLWAEAESPQTFHFLESRAASVPLRSDFKQPVTVLSRKPQLAKRQQSQSQSPSAVSPSPSSSASGALHAATAGIQHLSLSGTTSPAPGAATTATIATPPDILPNDDGDDDDDDDDGEDGPRLTPEELQAQREREREERQRKYEEVRERLFGSPSGAGSGASSPGSASITPPPSQAHSHDHSHHHPHSHRQGPGTRGRGRALRSNASSRESRERKEISTNYNNNNNKSNRQLYDPNCPARSTSGHGQRVDRRQNYVNNAQENGRVQENPQQLQQQQMPLRTPRGPDGSGRGGFGFSPRGAKSLVNQLHSSQPI